MRHKALVGFMVAAFVLGCAMLCLAGMESENYRIARSVQSGGGAFMVSETYVAGVTLGQASAIGPSASAGYALQAGFWISILAKGDVNGDGEVDLADLVLSLRVLAGMGTPDVHSGADVNGDGHIGLAEAIYILCKAAGLRD
jgi:hypothetical protein